MLKRADSSLETTGENVKWGPSMTIWGYVFVVALGGCNALGNEGAPGGVGASPKGGGEAPCEPAMKLQSGRAPCSSTTI